MPREVLTFFSSLQFEMILRERPIACWADEVAHRLNEGVGDAIKRRQRQVPAHEPVDPFGPEIFDNEVETTQSHRSQDRKQPGIF